MNTDNFQLGDILQYQAVVTILIHKFKNNYMKTLEYSSTLVPSCCIMKF